MKGPRRFKAFECSHMRPVIRINGVWTHLLPSGNARGVCEAGVYVVDAIYEGEHYVSDLASDDTVERRMATAMLEPSGRFDRPHPLAVAVYRIYDMHDRLLYVGKSSQPRNRFASHRAKQPWGPETNRIEVEWHDSEHDALVAELAAIGAENPIHNRAGR